MSNLASDVVSIRMWRDSMIEVLVGLGFPVASEPMSEWGRIISAGPVKKDEDDDDSGIVY